MIQNIWSVLCSKNITDVQSNNASLIDIPEEVSIFVSSEEQVPINVLVNLELVTYWERGDSETPEQGRFRVCLKFPGEHPTDFPNSQEATIDLTNNLRARVAMRIQALPVFQSGIHRFNVEVEVEDKWHQVASVPLLINKFQREEVPQDTQLKSAEAE